MKCFLILETGIKTIDGETGEELLSKARDELCKSSELQKLRLLLEIWVDSYIWNELNNNPKFKNINLLEEGLNLESILDQIPLDKEFMRDIYLEFFSTRIIFAE